MFRITSTRSLLLIWILDLTSGNTILKQDPSPSHGIAYDNGVIYAPTGPNGTVVALNADNGTKIWESPALQPLGGSFVLTSPPLVWKDYLILGSAFGDVVLEGVSCYEREQ